MRMSSVVLVAQLCPTLCDPVDYSPPGSFVHEILQAGILEWVAMPFSRESSQPRDQTQVSLQADSLPFESLSIFKILLLEYNCCALASAAQQSESALCIQISPPS